jgi:hypothetical protein
MVEAVILAYKQRHWLFMNTKTSPISSVLTLNPLQTGGDILLVIS